MMLDSSPEKLWYYEKYYQKKHQLPQAIEVDENKQLRDGYISYLLAKKYNVRADVCEMISGQLMRKIMFFPIIRHTPGDTFFRFR